MSGPLRIDVGKQHWNGEAAEMRSMLQTWEWRWGSCEKAGEVTLDFTRLEFMEPWALVMFACFGLGLRRRGVRVAVELDENNPANAYLRSMGLVHVVETGTSTPGWDQDHRNTGLHVIRTHQDVTRFRESAAALGIGAAQDTIDALCYGMPELARNVVQHSDSLVGGVALAQYFPLRKAVQLAICDHGRGIFESLRGNYPELRSDLEGLKLALLPYSSGAAPPGPYGSTENAGLGLFFCKEISWRTGGSFWLASQGALLGIKDNDSSGRGRIYRRINPWPGTLVAMHLPEQDIVAFDELLALCRARSAEARGASGGAAALDFADDLSDLPDDMLVVPVHTFLEDVENAGKARDSVIKPAIQRGELIVLDFGGARFVTQSFVQALLYDVFKIPGSLTKMTFRRCTKGTEEAIRLVAAYSATYRQQQL